MTGREWIEAVAEAMGVSPEYRRVPPFMVKGMGLIIPFMRELGEMIYQYDRNYHFDSSKLEGRFGFEPTPYRAGIWETVMAEMGSGTFSSR